jgi:1-acyl-sn-glycerol-3-phosphate acyltransferase
VTPHRHGPIAESLVPLPQPADTLLAQLEQSEGREEEVLRQTGHPNTYTFTKTLAEHLLVAHCPTPLSIVRPSIISASVATPERGWIDSTAGFGAFVMLIGSGHLRVIVGDSDARLDLVPVDHVVRCILDELHTTRAELTIKHAVIGAQRAPSVGACWEAITDHFGRNPVDRLPARRYIGPRNSAFVAADLMYHRLPMTLATLGSATRRRRAKKLASRLEYLNDVFPYFTSRTFDFASSAAQPDGLPADPREYVETVCRGVSRHLMSQRSDEWALAGRAQVRATGDLRWALRQPSGNAFVRFGVWASAKVLRRISEAVTVDVPSFERARDAVPNGAAIALVPTHRSFLDFILCSYLAFARPDLGIRIPFVAAAMEFGRIPLLGAALRQVQAFYVERGPSKENRDLDRRIHAMLAANDTLMFFIEGTRSRTRKFLHPKRGLLRCLQSSGRQVMLLPIAISYDRLPEEAVFAHELSGGARRGLRLAPLFSWLWDVWRNRVTVGRIHMACGAPLAMSAESDVRQIADDIIAELRGAMAVTAFHVQAFAAAEGVDPAALRAVIAASGVRILESKLDVPVDLHPVIARTYREHFAHLLDSRPPLDVVPLGDVAAKSDAESAPYVSLPNRTWSAEGGNASAAL